MQEDYQRDDLLQTGPGSRATKATKSSLPQQATGTFQARSDETDGMRSRVHAPGQGAEMAT